jgi:hypothetical protein
MFILAVAPWFSILTMELQLGLGLGKTACVMCCKLFCVANRHGLPQDTVVFQSDHKSHITLLFSYEDLSQVTGSQETHTKGSGYPVATVFHNFFVQNQCGATLPGPIVST